jgi:signal transduction histidine kinase
MFPTNSRTDSGSGQLDSKESIRQMDAAWRLWDSLTMWDTRFAWVVDTAVAVGLFLCCSGWIFEVGPRHPDLGFVAALTIPLLLRRRAPFAVFFVVSAIALVQLVANVPLLADVSLLVALYSVAAVSEWMRVIVSFLILQIGIVAATARWIPIRSYFESLVLLAGMAFAACLAGVVVRALRGQMSWLAERARRLELERDQQASLAAATERARIAREMHDVISHNLQVMVTLADAACIAQRRNSKRGIDAMAEVANTGRQAMTDMRRMLGLLRDETKEENPNGPQGFEVIPPQPRIEELDALLCPRSGLNLIRVPLFQLRGQPPA